MVEDMLYYFYTYYKYITPAISIKIDINATRFRKHKSCKPQAITGSGVIRYDEFFPP